MDRRRNPDKLRLPSALAAPSSAEYGYRMGRHIYFAQAVQGGLIKIGSANNPWERFQSLQACCPIPLRLIGMIWEGGRYQERQLHLRFQHLRQYSEWFDPGPELVAYITDHATDPYQLPEGAAEVRS